MHNHHRSVFSGMFSTVLESRLELDAPSEKEAGVSLYTDSSSSSEEAAAEAEPRLGVKPWAGCGCGCAAGAVWDACVLSCWT